jgi:spore maturation protein SpmB
MILNISANMLGLGNAATPFGLKAMGELNTLNPRPGVATDAMILFLVINTSGVAVLPLGAVAVRATLGSRDAAGIMIPSIVGTFLSTVASVLLFKLIQRWASPVVSAVQAGAASPVAEVKGLEEAQALAAERPPPPLWRSLLVLAIGAALLVLVARHLALAPGTPLETLRAVFSSWLLPVLMLAIVLVGFWREVRVYEAFIAAAKEGFQVGVLIIPYLVAILVAVGLFRASGAMESFTSVVGPYTALVGLPAEALPMALVRPLSGNGALGVMTETMKVHGPDSFIGYLVSLINGSSETTFYVLALYFGSVQVRATRYALAACLTSDAIGLAITVALAHLFF